jgi:hypothetical protein
VYLFEHPRAVHRFIGVEDIGELQLKAIDVTMNKAKSQRRATAKRE